MKSSISHFSSFQQSFSQKEKLGSATTSPRSYNSAKLLAKREELPKTLTKSKILDLSRRSKPFQEKKQKKRETEVNLPILSSKKSFPCLFVNSLQKKNEVLGTPLMNRFVRFLTKKGQKSKAYLLLTKASTLLAHFEAEKIDSKELLSLDLEKKSEKVQKTSERYKSQKRSQFLSRGKGKFLKHTKSFQDFENSKIFTFSSQVIVEQAVSHVKPFVEVKKVRVAGTTYQVPAILEKHRQENFALKWILQSAFERHKKNPSQPFEYSLASEIYEASKKQGQARMKRNELHKLAETHRAFAHFRWW